MLPTPPSGRPERRLLTAICLAAIMAVPPASADILDLTLSDALRLARERSGALHLISAELAALRAEAGEAALPAHDGELELSGGPRFDERDELDLEIAWRRSFEPRGARPARRAVADARVGSAEAEARLVRLELLAEVAELHALSLHAEARAGAARGELALAGRLRDAASTRRELGETGRLDESLALAARGRGAASLARAEAHRERSLGRLRAALGLAPSTELRVVGDLASLAARIDVDEAASSDAGPTHPRIDELRAREERADAELSFARSQGRSRRSVHAGVGREEDATLVFAGVSWTLPAGDRGVGLVEAAAARREGLRLARESLSLRTAALATGERNAAARLTEGLERLQSEGLAALEEATRLVGEAYELGALPLAEVLFASRELARARTEHLDLLRDAALSALHARTLAGQEPQS